MSATYDDIPERAVRDAVREAAPPGLTPTEALVIAGVAANRARQRLPAGATATEGYAAMNAAARQALTAMTERNAFRRSLVGGIESLNHQQQMALALRHVEGMNDAEIAAVMGLEGPEVRVLFLCAYQMLGDMT
jgi:DNA-directed RNA polymerase specialized sigma24 family protein